MIKSINYFLDYKYFTEDLDKINESEVIRIFPFYINESLYSSFIQPMIDEISKEFLFNSKMVKNSEFRKDILSDVFFKCMDNYEFIKSKEDFKDVDSLYYINVCLYILTVLTIISKNTVGSVVNHDKILYEFHKKINPEILYDSYSLSFGKKVSSFIETKKIKERIGAEKESIKKDIIETIKGYVNKKGQVYINKNHSLVLDLMEIAGFYTSDIINSAASLMFFSNENKTENKIIKNLVKNVYIFLNTNNIPVDKNQINIYFQSWNKNNNKENNKENIDLVMYSKIINLYFLHESILYNLFEILENNRSGYYRIQYNLVTFILNHSGKDIKEVSHSFFMERKSIIEKKEAAFNYLSSFLISFILPIASGYISGKLSNIAVNTPSRIIGGPINPIGNNVINASPAGNFFLGGLVQTIVTGIVYYIMNLFNADSANSYLSQLTENSILSGTMSSLVNPIPLGSIFYGSYPISLTGILQIRNRRSSEVDTKINNNYRVIINDDNHIEKENYLNSKISNHLCISYLDLLDEVKKGRQDNFIIHNNDDIDYLTKEIKIIKENINNITLENLTFYFSDIMNMDFDDWIGFIMRSKNTEENVENDIEFIYFKMLKTRCKQVFLCEDISAESYFSNLMFYHFRKILIGGENSHISKSLFKTLFILYLISYNNIDEFLKAFTKREQADHYDKSRDEVFFAYRDEILFLIRFLNYLKLTLNIKKTSTLVTALIKSSIIFCYIVPETLNISYSENHFLVTEGVTHYTCNNKKIFKRKTSPIYVTKNPLNTNMFLSIQPNTDEEDFKCINGIEIKSESIYNTILGAAIRSSGYADDFFSLPEGDLYFDKKDIDKKNTTGFIKQLILLSGNVKNNENIIDSHVSDIKASLYLSPNIRTNISLSNIDTLLFILKGVMEINILDKSSDLDIFKTFNLLSEVSKKNSGKPKSNLGDDEQPKDHVDTNNNSNPLVHDEL